MRTWAAVLSLMMGSTACGPRPEPIDLLRPEKALAEAAVAGRERTWVLGQIGKQVRIHDFVMRTLPAAPPSRLSYTLDIPRDARLSFACGIGPEMQDEPGVEFVVKVRRGDHEETLWTRLLDPIGHAEHRLWVPAEVSLGKDAGRGVELILETRGFPGKDDPRRAYWGAPVVTVPGHNAPLVILYLVDTLRADHTGPYGYARATTPELDAFSRDGVIFENAVAQASWTKPSVASILTSLLPGQHRVVQLRDSLDAGRVTLAEMLSARGYATGASIANAVIYTEGGNFEQGFDAFAGIHDESDHPGKDVKAGPVVDAALAWIRARRGGPSFVFVHTMDPHVPYSPPTPFDQKFEPHPTPDHPGVDPRTDDKEPEDRERFVAQYDGDIAYGDQEFGRFVRTLKSWGLYDDALIVFLADHGEEFQDHGNWLHGKSVFDELIKIPLIVKFPGRRDAGRRVPQLVQSVDVLPTVLESQGLPVPQPPSIAGRPLQTVLRASLPEPPAISEISHRGNVALGIRTGRDKYVQQYSPQEGELYFDLTTDPREQVSRTAEFPERVRFLRGGLEAVMTPNPFRHNLRFQGGGEYEVTIRTRGWIEGVEPTGFGQGDKYDVEQNGRHLALRVRPRPGQPREVAFNVRPIAVPVWLTGTRDGRPLRPADVLVGEDGVHPQEIPCRLPDLESEKEPEARSGNVFAAARGRPPGLLVWLTLSRGRGAPAWDKETCERLRALGYVGSCAGVAPR